LVSTTVFQHHRKLITAGPGYDEGRAEGFLEEAGDFAQRPVSLRAPESAINLVESFHSGDDERAAGLHAVGEPQLLFPEGQEAPPVVQTGEFIG
jgi:hypothetical protein